MDVHSIGNFESARSATSSTNQRRFRIVASVRYGGLIELLVDASDFPHEKQADEADQPRALSDDSASGKGGKEPRVLLVPQSCRGPFSGPGLFGDPCSAVAGSTFK